MTRLDLSIRTLACWAGMAVGLLTIASGGVGCRTTLSESARNEWFEARGPRFRLWTDGSPKQAQTLVADLERVHAVLVAQGLADEHDPRPLPLFIVAKDSVTFEALTQMRARASSGMIVAPGGRYYESLQEAYVYANSNVGFRSGVDFARTLLFGLYGRFLEGAYALTVPHWYRAALFTVVSNIELGSDGSYTWGCLLRDESAWIPEEWLPMQRVMGPDWKRADQVGSRKRQSWLALRYFSEDPTRHKQLARYLELWRAGRPHDALIRESFGMSPEELDLAVRKYSRSPLECIKVTPRSPPPAVEAKVRPLAGYEVDQQLGEFTLALFGPTDDAQQILARAAAARTSFTPTLASLARFHFRKAEANNTPQVAIEQAERFVAQLGRVAPQAVETRVLQGDLHRFRAGRPQAAVQDEIALARKAYREAIRRDELRADAYYGLGLTYLIADNGSKEGTVVLEAATVLRPTLLEVPIALARLHVGRGQRSEAIAVLERLRGVRDDKVRARIEQELERARATARGQGAMAP